MSGAAWVTVFDQFFDPDIVARLRTSRAKSELVPIVSDMSAQVTDYLRRVTPNYDPSLHTTLQLDHVLGQLFKPRFGDATRAIYASELPQFLQHIAEYYLVEYVTAIPLPITPTPLPPSGASSSIPRW
eukprot:NODE_20428_length_799_cov_2.659226.p1 GENE.NODE_20428_length_799_cov_2.659226~~NODE_20428_length_799_cov_2.659226.p1  ORF type:complete len:128 (+),score=15.85 NODE_20428_length_799_cov_2.659226:227-610(+)